MKYIFDEELAWKFYVKEIWEESWKKGWEQGWEKARKEREQRERMEEMEKGIRALIVTVKKYTPNKDVAVRGLVEHFDLLPQAAEEKVALYWR